jgi:hypothetical protein
MAMKNNAALWALLLTLAFAGPASACINSYHRREPAPPKPRPERADEFMAWFRSHPEHTRIVTGPPPTDPGPGTDYKGRSDYAAQLIRRGESRKAVEILESIERTTSGAYLVAANLGTAYELSGDLAKAHQWIREGIRRNPQSHDGTEWLHLRILEARQALAKNPRWLETNSVTGLDFGSDAQPRKPERWPAGATDAESVITALIYQLHERMAFVPGPDALVGSMIAELGVMFLLYRSAELAVPVLDLALTYRTAKPNRVEEFKSAAEDLQRSRRSWGSPFALGLIGFATVTLGGALFLRWRQAR